MKSLTKLAVISLTSLAISAQADSVFYGGYTYHLKDIKDYDGSVVPDNEVNNTNDLVGVEYKGYSISHFTNSYNDSSFAVSKEVLKWSVGDVELDLHAAIYTGYNVCTIAKIKDKVCFAVVPEIKYTKYDIQPSVVILGSAVSLMFHYEFN